MLSYQTSIQHLHTFGTPVRAKAFGVFRTITDLKQLIRIAPRPFLILGGGSNMLFRKDFPGTVLKNEIGGVEKQTEDEQYIRVRVGGGEDWHGFVLHCLKEGWAGVENLSLIPGTVGAAPIQNIGAYGVELKSVFESLEAVSLEDGSLHRFSAQDCQFGYRDSIFKRQAKGKFAIVYVNFRLHKEPVFHLDYGAIRQALPADEPLSIRAVSEAVVRIRQSKLPDPKTLGNSGSFFKNPVISTAQFERLKANYPDMPGYESATGVKVPAGWLIEQCGWKGKRVGNTGTYQKQALVLVNHGGAEGEEIYQLSEQILQSVRETFGIELEREVNILPA